MFTKNIFFKPDHPTFKQLTLNDEQIRSLIHVKFKALILPRFFGIQFNFYTNLLFSKLHCKYCVHIYTFI